jgi:Protein of unknown function (DUF2911)
MGFQVNSVSLRICATVLALSALPAAAAVEMPRRSPRARVSQRVGLTDVTVEYDSAAVRGRHIWGASVPFGKVWLSEIPPPKITFSKEVTFAEKLIPAGTYSLLLVPSQGDWTIILNKNVNLGVTDRQYKPDQDIARARVSPREVPFRERLMFSFSDFNDDKVWLDLEWEKAQVSIPIAVHTKQQLLAEIEALDKVGRGYADAARYMLEIKKDYATGLKYIDRSLALGENWYNVWIKASLLAASGRHREAQDLADRAFEMGQQSGDVSAVEAELRNPRNDWVRAPVLTVGRRPPASGRGGASTGGPAQAEPTSPPPIAVVSAEALSLHGPSDSKANKEPARLGGYIENERPIPIYASARPSVAVRPVGSEDIAPVIKKGRTALQVCYQRALREDPTLTHGRIRISATVGVSGRASNVVLDAPAPLRALEPCVKEAVSSWTFPTSAAEYGVEFPVILKGRE